MSRNESRRLPRFNPLPPQSDGRTSYTLRRIERIWFQSAPAAKRRENKRPQSDAMRLGVSIRSRRKATGEHFIISNLLSCKTFQSAPAAKRRENPKNPRGKQNPRFQSAPAAKRRENQAEINLQDAKRFQSAPAAKRRENGRVWLLGVAMPGFNPLPPQSDGRTQGF